MIFDLAERMEIYGRSVPGLDDLIAELERRDIDKLEDGTYSTPGGIRYSIATFMSTAGPKDHEIHEKSIDVQMVLEGRERMLTGAFVPEMPEGFDKAKDFGVTGAETESVSILTRGRFALIFPGEPHCPGLAVGGEPGRVRKLVAKIPWEGRR